MLRLKKNSYKEFDEEKKFLRLENSPPNPPITFLMVRPLEGHLSRSICGSVQRKTGSIIPTSSVEDSIKKLQHLL